MTTIVQPEQTVTAEDTRFDETVERWFRDRLEIQPEWATYLGIHDHDHRLSTGGRAGIALGAGCGQRLADSGCQSLA